MNLEAVPLCTQENILVSSEAILPNELWQNIFEYLTALDLTRCSQVCRRWRQIIDTDTHLLRVKCRVFGSLDWELYFGKVDEPGCPPDNINQRLLKTCPIWPNKVIFQTHIPILLPAFVNGSRLTLASLRKHVIALHAKDSSMPCVGVLEDGDYVDRSEEVYLNAPSWVLMTKDVLPGSRGKSYKDQLALISNISRQSDFSYRSPKLMEVVMSVFMYYLKSGEKHYSDSPLTYTRCEEKACDSNQVTIGCFTNHLGIYNGGFWDGEDVGLGALQILE